MVGLSSVKIKFESDIAIHMAVCQVMHHLLDVPTCLVGTGVPIRHTTSCPPVFSTSLAMKPCVSIHWLIILSSVISSGAWYFPTGYFNDSKSTVRLFTSLKDRHSAARLSIHQTTDTKGNNFSVNAVYAYSIFFTWPHPFMTTFLSFKSFSDKHVSIAASINDFSMAFQHRQRSRCWQNLSFWSPTACRPR